MLNQITARIDRFVVALAILLIVLAVVVIFTTTKILGAINTANEVDPKSLESNSVHIIESKLKSAEDIVNSKSATPLDLH